MGTVVAIETAGGVAIAGDRRATSEGTVTGESAVRVLDLDSVGAGAVGQVSDVDEFRRQFEADVREFELERDRDIDVETLGRIASPVAEDAGVDAVVATHDDDGVARLRQVDADGGVLSDSVVALGTGAQIAHGRLETVDRDRDLSSTEEFVRDVLETVAERDPDTGEEVDVWSLASSTTDG